MEKLKGITHVKRIQWYHCASGDVWKFRKVIFSFDRFTVLISAEVSCSFRVGASLFVITTSQDGGQM
jgi:hypothetical protein